MFQLTIAFLKNHTCFPIVNAGLKQQMQANYVDKACQIYNQFGWIGTAVDQQIKRNNTAVQQIIKTKKQNSLFSK